VLGLAELRREICLTVAPARLVETEGATRRPRQKGGLIVDEWVSLPRKQPTVYGNSHVAS
jgi:hypothetical protein